MVHNCVRVRCVPSALMSFYLPAGSAHAADSHSEAVPEEAF